MPSERRKPGLPIFVVTVGAISAIALGAIYEDFHGMLNTALLVFIYAELSDR